MVNREKQTILRRYNISYGTTLRELMTACGDNLEACVCFEGGEYQDDVFLEWNDIETDEELAKRVKKEEEYERRSNDRKLSKKLSKELKERKEYERLKAKFGK